MAVMNTINLRDSMREILWNYDKLPYFPGAVTFYVNFYFVV
jgi:hypothetical protein